MSNLNDLVSSVVNEFMKNGELFTALDVSNKVKETMPFARHREVRDVVRDLFSTDMVGAGYTRSPIQVTLNDGSKVDALLYHSFSDSWDLDAKYDLQKRQQSSSVVKATTVPVPATVSANGTVSVNPVVTPLPPVTTDARTLWQQLFDSQPSLFPRK